MNLATLLSLFESHCLIGTTCMRLFLSVIVITGTEDTLSIG
jgi:hypothetical protein